MKTDAPSIVTAREQSVVARFEFSMRLTRISKRTWIKSPRLIPSGKDPPTAKEATPLGPARRALKKH